MSLSERCPSGLRSATEIAYVVKAASRVPSALSYRASRSRAGNARSRRPGGRRECHRAFRCNPGHTWRVDGIVAPGPDGGEQVERPNATIGSSASSQFEIVELRFVAPTSRVSEPTSTTISSTRSTCSPARPSSRSMGTSSARGQGASWPRRQVSCTAFATLVASSCACSTSTRRTSASPSGCGVGDGRARRLGVLTCPRQTRRTRRRRRSASPRADP